MEIVERIVTAVKEITEALDDPNLDPDLERADWMAHRPAIDGLKARLEAEVIEPLKEALAALESAEDREALRAHAAFAVSETAALLLASQVATAGNELLKRALAIAPPGPAKEELQAGAKDSRNWLLLVRARWLIRQGRRGEADKLAKALAGLTREPRLKAGADEVLNAPRPISSAPPLFTLNGFGFGLYGSRDQHPDGSYVATHCVCALFIPVFPLAAYRVLQQESNRYLFLAKERLSGFARGYRNLVVVGILAAAGLGVAQAYLGSPARQAGVAISEARALAEDGKRDQAIEAYEEAVRRWHSEAPRSSMQEGGSALARLYAGDLPTPLTATGAQRAVRVVERWEKLPSAGRGGTAATTMLGLLQGWVDEIGTATPQAARAGLRLLAAAERIADGSRARAEVRQQRAAVQTALADSVADAWPLAALQSYAELVEDEAALAKAGAILDRIGDRHSLWIETRPAVSAWLEAVDRAGILRDVAGRTRKRLEAAEKAHAAPARQRAVQQNTAKTLGRLLAKDPADQHAAVALARLQRDAGRTRSALATIQKLDEPGWLISDAQYLLGVLYADLGRLEKAEGILEPYLAGRLAAFQEARKAYSDRSDAVRARVIRDAERGKLPSDLQAKLETASEDEGQALFAGWLAGELDADQELGDLKAAYESYADVAPASLTLGMVKLRRANAAAEKERDRLLGEAEGAFLSIREEAAGVPAYHLGLGQVYHRLGRPKEGDEELEAVLAEKDPELELAVAAIYRELGQIGRARDLAEKVWKSGAKPASENAAATMAMMATDLDEEEQWFERANQSMPYVKTSLLRIKGERLFRAGKLDAADRTFAQVVKNYAKEIKHDPVAANNAALIQQYRYMCRGDPKRLKEALDGLESALRLDPDNALVVGNLASTYAYAGAVRVLGKWFEPSLLRINAGDAVALLDALADGPLGNQVRTETGREAALRRSAELTDQEAILAPSSVDAYARALQWHVIRHDVEALGALRERVERVSGFDTTQTDERRRAYQNGEDDERLIEQLDAALGRLDLLVKAAEKKKHAPTVAAVHYLRGLRLREKSEVTGRIADAQAAVMAFRQVNRLWPTLDNGRKLARTLTELALLKAAAASEAVASHRGENVRLYTLPLLLHSMSIAPDGAEMIAALRGQAELGEATRLRRARPGKQPALMDWVLGRVAGDSELERTAARVFESEEEQIGAAVAARLDPTSKSAAMLLKLMTTKE